MKMYIKSVCVDDQSKALSFYTEKLGFVVKHDIPMGKHRWITLVSADEPKGVELGLEPNQHPAVKDFQAAMMRDGIPFTAFSVQNLDAEYNRLKELGVLFTQAPVAAGDVKIAVLNDTCGNLIQLIQLS
ncbi:VOC family protein [Fretibacter rubidus]|uniref:VOC family protein n=1 Tax=Fretibacter rubidus TaxID=570162 RepID=UPI00352B7D1E